MEGIKIKKSFGKPKVYKGLILGDCTYGKAVFANECISAGEIILEFGGTIISFEELPNPYEPEKDYFLQVGEHMYLGPSGEIDDFINHSCSPNCGIKIQNETIALIAICSINSGDQITFNYATTMGSNWGEFECACGSSDCHGMVKKFLELPPSIQKKYMDLNIIPDYILAKINNI